MDTNEPLSSVPNTHKQKRVTRRVRLSDDIARLFGSSADGSDGNNNFGGGGSTSSPAVVSSGFPELDDLLPEGGFVYGDVVELAAQPSACVPLSRLIQQMATKALIQFIRPSSASLDEQQSGRVVWLTTSPSSVRLSWIIEQLGEAGIALGSSRVDGGFDAAGNDLSSWLQVFVVHTINDTAQVLQDILHESSNSSSASLDHSGPPLLVLMDGISSLLLHDTMQYPKGSGTAASYCVASLAALVRSLTTRHNRPTLIVTTNSLLSGAGGGGGGQSSSCHGGPQWRCATDMVLVFDCDVDDAEHRRINKSKRGVQQQQQQWRVRCVVGAVPFSTVVTLPSQF